MRIPFVTIIAAASVFGVSVISCFGWGGSHPPEYWIGYTEGMRGGRGTESDPWVVGDARAFDDRLSRLPAGALVNLLPGEFATMGRAGFSLKSGQKLIGAGIGRTVLRLEAPPEGSPLAVVLATADESAEDVVVQDLTVDCNFSSDWGAITVQGVNLAGTFHTIRRVEVLGAAGYAQECFALGIAASSVQSRGNLIENCVVRAYAGGWCTAIFLVNNSCLADPFNPDPVFTRGVVRWNLVDLSSGHFPKGGGCAYGGGGLDGAVFTGNTSQGAPLGFNFDTTRILNTQLSQNAFLSCTYTGINARSNRPGDQIQNLSITNNAINMAPRPGQPSAFGIAAGGNAEAPAVNLAISGNLFTVTNPGATQITGLQLFGWGGTAAITDNTFDPAFGQNLQPGPAYQLERNSPEIRSK